MGWAEEGEERKKGRWGEGEGELEGGEGNVIGGTCITSIFVKPPQA